MKRHQEPNNQRPPVGDLEILGGGAVGLLTGFVTFRGIAESQAKHIVDRVGASNISDARSYAYDVLHEARKSLKDNQSSVSNKLLSKFFCFRMP